MSTLGPAHQKNLKRGLSLEQMIVLEPGCSLVRYTNGETWLITESGGKRVKRVYSDSQDGQLWYLETPERLNSMQHCRLAEEVKLRSIQF